MKFKVGDIMFFNDVFVQIKDKYYDTTNHLWYIVELVNDNCIEKEVFICKKEELDYKKYQLNLDLYDKCGGLLRHVTHFTVHNDMYKLEKELREMYFNPEIKFLLIESYELGLTYIFTNDECC